MKINTIADWETIRDIIGEKNYEAGKRYLADEAGDIWFFSSKEEIENCEEITVKEKEFCLSTIEKYGWTGIVRDKPKPRWHWSVIDFIH